MIEQIWLAAPTILAHEHVFAAIAQPVERILGKDEVASSNLASSSIKSPKPFGFGLFICADRLEDLNAARMRASWPSPAGINTSVLLFEYVVILNVHIELSCIFIDICKSALYNDTEILLNFQK